ncbi:MAG: alpha/beta hydrolase [Alphaproteobacteria bacterium]|nr:alpha/beta hydrolase [Alphaproteobacteria bacterium]
MLNPTIAAALAAPQEGQMDYRAIMDADVWAFIEETNAHHPATLQGIDNQRGERHQRAQYNALCAHFHPGRPQGVNVTDTNQAGVATRRYTRDAADNAQATVEVLYIHGGGFVVGNLDTHDDICGTLCLDTGFAITAVDYRLAPEHKHPAALEDCRTVLDQLIAQSSGPVLVMGDSAGGWLAAMLACEVGAAVAGQLLIYPMLGGRLDQGSYLEHAEAPLLTTAQVKYYWETYFDCPLREDALTPPMAYQDVEGMAQLAPAVIIGAGCDPLYSDSPDYAAKLKQAGVNCRLHTERGLPHGYMRARHSAKSARESYARVVEGLKDLAEGKI